MSILLEALRQKSQREQVSPDKLSLPEQSLVVNQVGQSGDASLSSTNNVGNHASMDELVAALSIEPPEGISWQLTPLVKPSVADPDTNSPHSGASIPPHQEGKLFAPLELDLISPTPPAEQQTECAQPTKESVVESGPLASLKADAMPPTDVADLAPMSQRLEVAAERTTASELGRKEPTVPSPEVKESTFSTQAVKHEIEPPSPSIMQFTEPVSHNRADEGVAEPLHRAAERFLSITRKTVSPSAAPLIPEPAKAIQHSSKSAYARRSILIVGSVFAGIGAVIYASLFAWQTQQENYSEQMTHYRNLASSVLSDEISNASPASNEAPSLVESTQNSTDTQPSAASESTETSLFNQAVSQNASLQTSHDNAMTTINSNQKKKTQVLDSNRTSYSSPMPSSTGNKSTDASSLSIVKTSSIAELIQSAYQFWQMGQLVRAEALYRQVLESQPNQRDALLGMLAVSQANGSDRETVMGYARTLSGLYPHDNEVAMALSYLLPSSPNVLSSESELKQAVQAGDTSQVNYRLGLIYAEQQRWSEAQLVFFEAVKANPYQANYRLNLAISLDHLGKHALALTHYQAVLAMPNAFMSGTDIANIQERIAYLQAHMTTEE